MYFPYKNEYRLVEEYLPSKHEALTSNPMLPNKTKQKKE
jgi:hypothetical protein